ncbi:hypothetical protein [Croceivirga sp. JEA036]|uniref:hypothetical protein n=1 Tax=Croceivirga sp. JEA036 TaxID=2721162 RepID=UPI00143B06BE|nr:hypothetical protein [Croceivirga sp. JEA036]NJB38140.1 hypothetical protein [Croceivirga sp. JEA036]
MAKKEFDFDTSADLTQNALDSVMFNDEKQTKKEKPEQKSKGNKKIANKPKTNAAAVEKVREHFYVSKESMDVLKRYVLEQKLKGDTKISNSSLVDEFIAKGLKKMGLK